MPSRTGLTRCLIRNYPLWWIRVCVIFDIHVLWKTRFNNNKKQQYLLYCLKPTFTQSFREHIWTLLYSKVKCIEHILYVSITALPKKSLTSDAYRAAIIPTRVTHKTIVTISLLSNLITTWTQPQTMQS
jgi:hypothetical protein